MNKDRKLNLIGQLLLLLATIAWGSSFVILKKTIEDVPGFFVIGIRFCMAGIIMVGIFFKKVIKINKTALIQGCVLGVTVALAYFTQTWGLKYTTPSRNAFLTALYCILCPFICWIFLKRKPKIYNLISAVLSIVGIGLISLSGQKGGGTNLLLGDGLTLVCAVFYSLQIIFIDKYQGAGTDTLQLITVQFFVVGVILLGLSACLELPVSGLQAYKMNGEQWGKVLYLTFACTLFAQGAQMFGQRYTSPNQSAIILSLEAVFGMVFSLILGDEVLTLPLGIGFGIIFVSIMISELKFNPAKLFKRNKQ